MGGDSSKTRGKGARKEGGRRGKERQGYGEGQVGEGRSIIIEGRRGGSEDPVTLLAGARPKSCSYVNDNVELSTFDFMSL